jgi:hypothetical protein
MRYTSNFILTSFKITQGAIVIKSYKPMRSFSRDSNAPADSVFFWDNTIFYQLALDTDRSLRVYRMQV